MKNYEKNYCIKSETGSGKTLAYMVPILNYLATKEKRISRDDGSYVIVVCPTRELVIQCMEVSKKIMHWVGWIILGEIMGGENIKKEKPRLRKGITVLFTTTGRFLYHLQNTQSFVFTHLKFLVFEECDRTLDMGFKKDLDQIIQILQSKIDLSKTTKILISATFSERVQNIYKNMGDEEIQYFGFNDKVKPLENKQTMEVEGEEEEQPAFQTDQELIIPKTLKQYYSLVNEEDRIRDFSYKLLNSNLVLLQKNTTSTSYIFLNKSIFVYMKFHISLLIAYIHHLKPNSKAIVFVSTCDEVEYLEYVLTCLTFKDQNGEIQQDKKMLENFNIYKLHGNIEQKSRTKTYFDFKKTQNSAILLSTEVASRGLDFPDVSHSILLDPPAGIIDYCNRIGRTARIDKIGKSFLILNPIEKKFIEKLQEKDIKIKFFDYTQIVEDFNQTLRDEWGIGMRAIEYIRSCLKNLFVERESYLLARRAYNSYLRAYARLPFKEIFQIKNMNLQDLAKSFGVISVGSKGTDTKDESYKEGLKSANYEKFRHKTDPVHEKQGDFRGKRKVVHSSKVIASEFM